MTTYLAPIRDMRFVLNELADLDDISQYPGYEEASPDLVDAVLEEAARFASEALAPLNKVGDEQGSRIVDGKVAVPDGFETAYHEFVQSGWAGLAMSPEFGGQGLPQVLNTAVSEMWNSANMSFALCPLLTTGAVEAIATNARDEIKARYLEKMVSGGWTGTMNLTEPQAGSDLAAVRTKAEPEGDHFRITGQKIFITWGDHEMTENIVHLVLARLPDAPPGVKGISLFVVPKYLVNEDGSVGERNDVHPVSLEHKLGVHASPTCVMSFGDKGGAVGYLVGEPNQGLAYMFVMMNHARLGCGTQGVAIAERAYQQAVSYARERVQGELPGQGRVTIVNHADVRRMLMLMKSMTEAMRAVAYLTGSVLDRSHHEPDVEARETWRQRLELLTPIAKAWCTEIAQEVTTLGVQVHGGMGFIEETGCAQHFRDGRIITIYEGTTGIQANDLVGRKVLRDAGAAMSALLEEIAATESELRSSEFASVAQLGNVLGGGGEALAKATNWLLENSKDNLNVALSAAVNFLMLTGTVVGGWQMARAALIAQQKLSAGDGDLAFYNTKLATAQFYFDHIMPRAPMYLSIVQSGEGQIMALAEDQF